MTSAIQVLDLRRVENAGAIRAFVRLRVGGVTIVEAKIVQEPNKRPWVAMPDRQWTDTVGKKHYVAHVELTGRSGEGAGGAVAGRPDTALHGSQAPEPARARPRPSA